MTREVPGTSGRALADADGKILLDGEEVPPRRRANGYGDLWLPGRGMMFVHRAVCEAWHGLPPSPVHQPDHGNRDRTDNRAENLRWRTPVENAANRDHRSGADHVFASLTRREAEAVRRLHASGVPCPQIAKAFDISRSTVWRAATGRTYR